MKGRDFGGWQPAPGCRPRSVQDREQRTSLGEATPSALLWQPKQSHTGCKEAFFKVRAFPAGAFSHIMSAAQAAVCFPRLHLDVLASSRLSDWAPWVHTLGASARPLLRSHTCSVGLPGQHLRPWGPRASLRTSLSTDAPVSLVQGACNSKSPS